MRFYNGRKLAASNVRDCKGIMNAIGLRFKRGFGNYDAYLIHMLPDSILDSFFVFMDFTAVWLDKDLNVLDVKLCKKNRLFMPVKNQRFVLELPPDRYDMFKAGDKLRMESS